MDDTSGTTIKCVINHSVEYKMNAEQIVKLVA